MVSVWSFNDTVSDFPYTDSEYRTMFYTVWCLSNCNTYFGSSFRIVAIISLQFWSIVPYITILVELLLIMLYRTFCLISYLTFRISVPYINRYVFYCFDRFPTWITYSVNSFCMLMDLWSIVNAVFSFVPIQY